MAITTVADVQTQTGRVFTADEQTRITQLIPAAERYVKRQAGRVFYDAIDPASDASQDWLLVVSLLVEAQLVLDDPEVKAALHGPYQSEKVVDYSYTLKSQTAGAVTTDPRIAEILNAYRDVGALAGLSFALAGPTRAAAVPATADDLTRWPWTSEGAEQP